MRVTALTSSAGSTSPAIRQDWLRSTSTVKSSPSASRTPRTAASPSSMRSRAIRILVARKPSSRAGQRRVDPLLRALELAGGHVRGQPGRLAAEQGGHRQPGHLAGDVPQRGLQRPVPPGVEVDRLQRPHVPGDPQRIVTDEQVGVRLEAGHRVARPDTGQAGVGLDPYQGGVEPLPRHRVPRGPERRVERQPEPVEPDRGDLHLATLVTAARRCAAVTHGQVISAQTASTMATSAIT